MARTPSPNAEAIARLMASGPGALDDPEALQVAVGLGDAACAALFAEFGSLPQVLAASPAALARCVSAQQAARVTLLKDMARRLLAAPLRARPVLSGWAPVADYLRLVLAGRTREQLRGLFLDKRNRLIRVHLTVKVLGDDGRRLNPRKADLEAWRQALAQALRDRGVEAEATPRRTRGVTRKAERGALRQIRRRFEAGRGARGHVARDKIRAAAEAAFGGIGAPKDWERHIAGRQAALRRLYLAQAKLLQASGDPLDRAFGVEVETFMRAMPPPDTERLALARSLREANARSRERSLAGREKGRSWR